MATKIFVLSLVVLLTIQGLSASSLSKRDLLNDMTSQLETALNNAGNLLNQLFNPSQQQFDVTIGAFLDGANKTFNDLVAAAISAGAEVMNIEKDINDEATAVVANVSLILNTLKGIAEDKIKYFTDLLQKYGDGTYGCVSNYSGNITSVIETSASSVGSCTVDVVKKATPIFFNATEIAAKLLDVNSRAAAIAACLPSGIFAVVCLAVDGLAVYNDIKDIAKDVTYIIQEWPVLIQEIQLCSADVQQAITAVFNLLGEIQTCVNTYVSSTPGSSPA